MKSLSAALLLTILIFSAAIPAYGQGNSPPSLPSPTNQDIRFSHLTTDDGLSHNWVYAIVQDQAGFLWIGTQDGLNRFDGYDFAVYKPDYEDPNSIGDRIARALLVDQNGSIWIATHLGGLNRYDPVVQTFSHYRHEPDDPESLTPGAVLSLYEDRSGIIWAGTEQGLNSIDPTSGEIAHYLHSPDDPTSISHNAVRAMYEDANGVLWVGTYGGGLNALDRTSGEFTHYRHVPVDPNSLCDDRVWTMMEDSFGIFWIGTQGGLYAFDPQTGSGTCYRHDSGNLSSLGNDLVKAIYEDSQGLLWVGTWGGGLNLFDRESGEFIRYQHDPLKPAGLSGNKVAAIYEDEGGVLWIGAWGGGLDKFDRAQQRFIRIQHDPGNSSSLNNNIVYSVYETKNGVIWIGTETALNRFDGSWGQLVHYQNDPNDPTTINVGEAVYRIIEDRDGVLWVGSWAEGLNRYDTDTEQFQHYRNDPKDAHSISSDVVLSIYEDSAGILWIGTLDGGLNKFDRQTESFQVYRHNPQDPRSISEDHVLVIYEDQSGRLWLGTRAGGLNWFDRETEQFGVIRHDPDDPESLSADRINAIYQDTSGVLWVGTPNGLNQIIVTGSNNPQDGTIKRYTEKNGLPSDVIQSILEDDEGYLWFSTTRGISRFDPQTESIENYATAHGLSGDAFNQDAAIRLSSGEMLFGGSAGLTLFSPSEITNNPYVPPIKITDFKLLNKSVGLGGDSPLQYSVWETDEVSLSHQDDVLTIEFAALSYANPPGNQYQYVLEGFDNEWSPVGDQRSATYTNLDPGEYVFRVRGSNNDGVWNEEGASLSITITPPWWATWWFRGIVLLALVGPVVGAYRWRMRSMQARSRELEIEIASRTRDLQAEAVEHEKTENRLRRTRDQLTAVLDVSRDLGSTVELGRLLELTVSQLEHVIEFDAATIHLLEDDVLELRGFDRSQYAQVLPPQRLFYKEIALFRTLIDERQGFILPDLQADPSMVAALIANTDDDFVKVPSFAHGFMAAPLVLRSRGTGMLVLISATVGAYGPESLDLLQIFANQLAVAIENAQRYEQAQSAAVAEERNRLAHELHDSVTQTLFSASVMAETTPTIWARDPAQAEQNLEKLRLMTRGALAEMRTLLLELRPAAMEQLPLSQLITTLCDSALSHSRVPVELTIEGGCAPPNDVKFGLYRIAQEALNNVTKHAEATEITVKLTCYEEQITLVIGDNGRGFDLQAIPAGHMGLTIMRERAQQIGATLQITSSPGSGTEIVATWSGYERGNHG